MANPYKEKYRCREVQRKLIINKKGENEGYSHNKDLELMNEIEDAREDQEYWDLFRAKADNFEAKFIIQ